MRDDQAASVLPVGRFAGWSRHSSRRCALVVAGEASLRALAATAASECGWAVETCATGTDAILRLSSQPPSVLIYAEPLPDMPASQLWRAAGPSVRFALRLLTDEGSASGAGAPPTGGRPGVTPPHVQTFDVRACAASLERALVALDAIEVPPAPVPPVCIADSDEEQFHGLVGATPVMRDLLGLVRRLAPHVRTALIVGEPGSGKESIARVLHRVGPRAVGRFLTLDCASLGDAAAETFGVPWPSTRHAQAWGVFHEAAGGVLFLDAVGDLTATAQGRLLTALEARGFSGAAAGAHPAPDVHVFAASSRDLRPDVASGRFRRDLFYHLSVVELRVPSLRERRGDIARLACSFLRTTGHRMAHGLDGFTEDAEALLTNAPWEGNVSELRALVERVSLLAEGPLVTAREVLACLPEHLAGRGAVAADRDARERAQTLAALEEAGGNKKAAAESLGLSRRAFYRRLERLAMADTIARRPARRLAS